MPGPLSCFDPCITMCGRRQAGQLFVPIRFNEKRIPPSPPKELFPICFFRPSSLHPPFLPLPSSCLPFAPTLEDRRLAVLKKRYKVSSRSAP